MMRALFSGVSGLKSHQTRMDVIGNNIANVNTVAYKSQSMTFSEQHRQLQDLMPIQVKVVLMLCRLVLALQWVLYQQQ